MSWDKKVKFASIMLSFIFIACSNPGPAADVSLSIDSENITYPEYRVISVVDGDTLKVSNSKAEEITIRLCGIDTPELSQQGGPAVTEYVAGKLAESNHRVHINSLNKDRYGRTVAEVFVPQNDNSYRLLSEIILSFGHGFVYTDYINTCPHSNLLIQAEENARNSRYGFWALNDYCRPWDYKQGNCDRPDASSTPDISSTLTPQRGVNVLQVTQPFVFHHHRQI